MTWASRNGALLAAVTVACLFSQMAPRAQQSVLRPLPVLVDPVAPEYPAIAKSARVSGSVELNVVTDGERVTSVEIVKPTPLLDSAAQRAVAKWVFVRHVPTSFRTTVEFRIHSSEYVDPASCVTRDSPETVTHDLPTRVEVVGYQDLICDKVEPVKRAVTASSLAGRVVCDCPDRSPVADATVSYYRQPSTRAERRGAYSTEAQGYVSVDADGRFHIPNAPAGQYSLEVGSLTSNSRAYHVNVVEDGRSRPPLSLAIVPNPAVATYLREHPREHGWIGIKRIPIYPTEALKADVAGSVLLRISPGAAPVALEGHSLLASGALNDARTWETISGDAEPFNVRLTYRLVAGDCNGGGPKVVLKLPREIEITAKRVVPCGPR
jgi:TonB family protein